MATILVVDDQPAIRVLVRASLRETGHRLLEAADGLSALRMARRERPALILLDIAIPGMNGLEVCRRLKEDPATAAIAVLLLTGLTQQDPQQMAKTAGAEACITKPFSPSSLVTQIAGALRKEPAAASQ